MQTLADTVGGEMVSVGVTGPMEAGLIFPKDKALLGADVVIQAAGVVEYLKNYALVFTGKGRLDNQTARGRTLVGVTRIANDFGLPVIIITGKIASGYEAVYQPRRDAVFSIASGTISRSQCREIAEELIIDVAERAIRLFICGRRGRAPLTLGYLLSGRVGLGK
jgi:glycerate kinase